MATSYTSLLGLALPVTGELAGTWGDVVNNSITSLLDSAVAGTTTLSTDADVTLTTTTGSSNQARQAILVCSGARTSLRTITAPAQSKIYAVVNNTTGGYAVKIVGVGPTTGVTVANGKTAVVVWNGADFVEVAPAVATNLSGGATGSVPYQSAASTTAMLAIGTANQVLTSSGTAPQWSSSLTVTGLTNSGNLTFTGTANRILGDFSNATIANRASFQTSTVNGGTGVQVLPNGTAVTSNFRVYNNSDPTNAAVGLFSISGSFVSVQSSISGTGTYLPLTFQVGGSETMRIDTSGNVGIGTSAQTARLQLAGNTTASAWTTGGVGIRSDAATYTDSSTAASGTVATSGIHAIAQPTIAASNATVTYTNAATLYVANAPAAGTNVTITNPYALYVAAGNSYLNGSVGIGVNPPAYKLDIATYTSGTTNTQMVANFIGNTAYTAVGKWAGVSFGTQYAKTAIISYDNYNNFGRNDLIFAVASGANSTPVTLTDEKMRLDNAGNLGIGRTPSYLLDVNGSARFNTTIGVGNTAPAASGAGVSFPATQSASSDANTLDDYEEGTFTPTVIGSSGAGTATYTFQLGQYTKVGNVVTFSIYLYWSAGTGTGNLLIGGLPFTVSSSRFPACSFGVIDGLSLTANNVATAYVQNGNTYINIKQYPVGGGAATAVPYDAAVNDFIISGSYFTAT